MVNYLKNWSAAQQFVVWQQQQTINNRALMLSASPSAASLFLAANGPHGMVLDFADASIAINDAADLLDFESSGQVSGGALVGPGAKLTYSAPSAKLTEQSDGLLKFQAHNLALWSEDISNAAWNKSNVTVSGTVATATGAASNKFIRQLNLVSGGPSYSIQFDVAAGTHSLVQIYTDTPTTAYANFDLANGVLGTVGSTATATIEAIGGGVYRCTANFVSTGTNARLSFIDSTSAAWNATSSSTGTISVTRAHFRRTPSQPDYIKTTTAAAYDLPYVWSGGVRQGLHESEAAATNLFLNSRAPVAQNITTTAQTYTLSFYGTGSVTLSGTASATLNGTGANDRVRTTVTATAGTLTVTPSGSVDLVQVETGTVATSPIITYGGAGLRVADNIYTPTSDFPYSSTECFLFAEVIWPLHTPVNATIVQINNAGVSSSGPSTYLQVQSATLSNAAWHANNVTKAFASAPTAGSVQRIAATFNTSGTLASATNQGQAVATSALSTWNGTGNRLQIGALNSSGQQVANMVIRKIMYLPVYDTAKAATVTA